MSLFKIPYWRLLPFLPLMLAFGTYFQTTNFDFVWDDRHLLLQSSDLRSWDSLWGIAGKAFLDFDTYFRPLPLLTLGIEQILFGGSSFIPHLNAVLLFGVNCALVACLASLVYARQQMSLRAAHLLGVCCGTLYALHPALIESASWISARFDLLMTFFALMMLIADQVVVRRSLRVLLVSSFFFMAALSKEMIVGMALAFPLWHWYLSRYATHGIRGLISQLHENGHLHVYAGIFFSGVCYLALRYAGISGFYSEALVQYPVGSEQHLLCVLKTLGGYLSLAVWPFTGLGPLHTLFLPLKWSDAEVLAGAAGLMAVAGTGIAMSRGYRGPAACLAVYVVSLAPVLNVIPLQIGGSYLQERFLAFPLIFFSIGLTLLVRDFYKWCPMSAVSRSALVGVSIIFWTTLCSLNLRAGIPFWKDSLSLWTLAYMREPDSRMAQTNLQTAYINAGLYGEAKKFTEELVARRSGRLEFEQVENYLLALSHSDANASEVLHGMVARMDAVQKSSTGGSKQFARIYANLAWLYLMDGQLTCAKQLYERSLVILPNYPLANYGVGVAYSAEGSEDLAARYFSAWRKHAHPNTIALWQADIPNLVRKSRLRISQQKQDCSSEMRSGPR